MARAAITVLKMTTANSSVSAVPTMAAVDSDTGAYVDVNNIDASKVLFVFQKTASGANSASEEYITIEDGDSKIGFSAYKLGDLTIDISSAYANVVGSCNLVFAGPFETARFKDSDGHIKINCTNATNVGYMGAILI